MYKATLNDNQLVVKILSEAFDDNKSVNFVVRQNAFRKDRIRKLMEYSFNVSYAFGEVWVSDDRQACALVVLPDKKRLTYSQLYGI